MDWPGDLVEDLARRRAVLFLGAGVSMSSLGTQGAHPPSWEGFLRLCLNECAGDTKHIEKLLDARDYLTACELLKAHLAHRWPTIVSREFAEPEFEPADIHHSIFRLDLRVVLTQNVDKIYDVHAQAETKGATKIKNYYDSDTAAVLRRKQRAVIKVHGTIDEPSRMIFTRSEYAQARHEHKRFQELIDALYLTHTFLFLGCGFDDPDLRLFFEQHAVTYPGAPPHYITVPTTELHPDVEAAMSSAWNLQMLRYDPRDDHSELVEGLGHLVTLVEEQRLRIAESQDW